MAESEKRRVTIFINGKEVANSIKAISAESRKLRTELSNMTRGTDAYNKKMQEMARLNKIVSDHNAQLRGTAGIWGKLKTEVKQFGIMAMAYLGTGQLLNGIDNLIQRSAKLDDTFADVRKTTGMTAEEVKTLNEELSKIDTRTGRQELLGLATIAGKLGIQGVAEVKDFVESADKINVALGEDLGGNVEEVVRQLGTLSDLFGQTEKYGIGESLNKIGSAINDLGSASKAKEADIVDFTNSMGGIAPQANMSIQDIMGLGAALSNLGQESSVASTVFAQVLPDMFNDTKKYADIAGVSVKEFKDLLATDSNEAMLIFLEGLQKNNGGLEELGANLDSLGLDGKKATVVLGSLSNNTKLLREQQDLANTSYEEGISLITEFDIKNNTLAAVLEKLQKRISGAFVSTEAMEALKRMAFWVQENLSNIIVWGRRMAILGASFVSFKVTLFALNNAYKAGIAIKTAYRTATIAVAGAKALLTGNTQRAAAAMRILNITMKTNPLVMFASLVMAAATAIFFLGKKTKEATEEQNKFNESFAEGQRLLSKQESLKDRMKTINSLSKQQLQFLLDDVEQELQANIKKDAAILSSNEKYSDKYKLLVENREQSIKEALERAQKAKDENTRKYYINQYVMLLNHKDDVITEEEGITQKSNSENKARLEDWKKTLTAKLGTFKETNTEVVKDDKATTDKLLEERKRLLDELDRLEIGRLIKDSNDPEMEAIKSNWDEKIQLYRQKFGEESEEVTRLQKLRNQELDDLDNKRNEESLVKWNENMEKLRVLKDEAFFLTLDAEEQNSVKLIKNEHDRNLEILKIHKRRAEKQLEIDRTVALESVTGLEGEKDLREQIEENHKAKMLAIDTTYTDAVNENTESRKKVDLKTMVEIGNATANFLGVIAGMMNEGTAEWKAMKVAQATISMFTGMATALEKGGIVGGIEAAAVLAMGGANIASIISTQIPEVPEQYYTGGYRTVRGGKDGKTYNAKQDFAKNGGHVNETSLVLGGEQGPEYWVNDSMLKIPAVANITNAMEQLRTKQISVPDFENIVQNITVQRQFVKGGYDGGMPNYNSSSTGAESSGKLERTLDQLMAYLKNPPPNTAIMDYDYKTKTESFIKRIQNDARG